jgi:hypothetical protein
MQRQVSSVRDNERAQQASADRQQTNAIDEKDTTVETTDDDTRIHPDAEGTGSQGRPFSNPEDQQPDEEEPRDPDSGDDEGRHIDLTA